MPGRAPEPSQSRVDDDGGDGTFRGILIGCLGFSVNEVFMGEGLTLGEACGPHTTSSRAEGGTHAARGVGAPLGPRCLPFAYKFPES